MIVWCVAIFVSSSIPSDRLPAVGVFGFDKIVHFGIYLVLCLLLHRSLRNQSKFPFLRRHSLIMSIIVSILYGMTDEFHQLFVPGRSSSVYDLFANALGGLSYSVYWHLWGKKGAETTG